MDFVRKAKTTFQQKRTLISLMMATLGLLVLRGRLMGFSPPKFAKADNPASASESLLTRTLTLAFLPAFNFWLMICPSQLAFDWSMDALPLITQLSDLRNLGSAIFYAGLAMSLMKAMRKKSLAVALAVMCLSFLPATNLLFYVGFVVAERVLYIPSIGLCLLLADVLSKTFRRTLRPKTSSSSSLSKKKMAFLSLMAVLVMCFGLKTWNRNYDWLNEERLYRSGIAINPAKG